MASPKRHLLLRWPSVAACGLSNPRHYSSVPAEVSCKSCQRSIAMADAEVRTIK